MLFGNDKHLCFQVFKNCNDIEVRVNKFITANFTPVNLSENNNFYFPFLTLTTLTLMRFNEHIYSPQVTQVFS